MKTNKLSSYAFFLQTCYFLGNCHDDVCNSRMAIGVHVASDYLVN